MNSVRTLFLALLFGAATLPALAQTQYTPPPVTVTNPLSHVHYQYKWEIYGGFAYSHFTAGPQLIQGAALGGVDAQATRFFNTKWGVDANYRGYFGSSGSANLDLDQIGKSLGEFLRSRHVDVPTALLEGRRR